MVKLEIEGGIYEFKLDDILKQKSISINKIMRDTNTDFKVLKRILTGELVRFDIFVVARLCDYLDCSITDIIDYTQNNEKVSWNLLCFQLTFCFTCYSLLHFLHIYCLLLLCSLLFFLVLPLLPLLLVIY